MSVVSTDRRTVRTRARVLEAARYLFAQEGYAGTSMESIARRAGVVRATVYNNFEDKLAILRSILSEYMKGYVRIADELRANARPEQNSFELIESVVREAIAWRTENADLRPLVDMAKHLPDSGWDEMNSAADSAMLDWILEVHRRDNSAGLLREELDIEFATTAVYSMIESVLSSFDVAAGRSTINRVAHQLALLQWYAIHRVGPAEAPSWGNAVTEAPG